MYLFSLLRFILSIFSKLFIVLSQALGRNIFSGAGWCLFDCVWPKQYVVELKAPGLPLLFLLHATDLAYYVFHEFVKIFMTPRNIWLHCVFPLNSRLLKRALRMKILLWQWYLTFEDLVTKSKLGRGHLKFGWGDGQK